MHMGRCCHCGCTKVNFKAFDFTDGDLLWQRLLYSPVIATNGEVYAAKYDTEFEGWTSAVSAISDATVVLPTRSTAPTDTFWEYSIDRHAAADGAIAGNSGLWGITSQTAGDAAHRLIAGRNHTRENTYRGLTASAYQVNATGDLILNEGTTFVEVWVTEPNTTATEVTYYIEMMLVPSGHTFDFVSDQDTTATVGLADSAATIQSTISSAFGSEITSVTVTGDSLSSSMIKVVIDWADNTRFLKSMKLDYGLGPRTLGNAYLRNLRTAIRGTYANTGGNASAYNGDACWQDSGNVFRRGANPSSASTDRFESWDTSTTPWTLDWSDEPFVSRTPIVTGVSQLVDLELCSGGGICAISFPLTSSLTGGISDRMTVISWNDDGTGEVDYHNSGNLFTGHYPLGLCVQDDGDDLLCHATIWRDFNVEPVHGSGFTSEAYGSNDGRTSTRWTSGSGYATTHLLNRGDFAVSHCAGFDNTRLAFVDIQNRLTSTTEESMEVTTESGNNLIATWVTEEASGIGTPELSWWRLNYQLFNVDNALVDSSTEWRLRFNNTGELEEEFTDWFSTTATLADLNSDLLTRFGSNTNGDQNIEAEVGTGTYIIDVPLFQRNLTLNAYSAQDPADETALGTAPVFTVDEANANQALGSMPECHLELRTFGTERTNSLGAILFSDGSEVWARNFNSGTSPKSVLGAQLHGTTLYALSVEQCEEAVEGPTPMPF